MSSGNAMDMPIIVAPPSDESAETAGMKPNPPPPGYHQQQQLRHSNAHLQDPRNGGSGAGAAVSAGNNGPNGGPNEFQTTTLTRRRVPGGGQPPPLQGQEHCSEMDLSSYNQHLQHHQASIHTAAGVVPSHQRQHELRRPDSVITTSSIVSSDTASQAGDSTELGIHCPPSVYTISGLYGGGGGGSSSSGASSTTGMVVGGPPRSRSSGPSDNKNPSSMASSSGASNSGSSSINSASLLSSSDIRRISNANAITSAAVSTVSPTVPVTSSSGGPSRVPEPTTVASAAVLSGHRRQASHPGHFQGQSGAGTVSTNTSGSNERHLNQQSLWAQPGQVTTASAKGSSLGPEITSKSMMVNGHRRSNSYGHHRALTGTSSCGNATTSGLSMGHRRTGSSVIETLQTLTCSGAETDKREESIAQFLENLKKEQQEK